MEMIVFTIPRPTIPKPPVRNGPAGFLDADQQDNNEFQRDLYKQDVKSYVMRRDFFEKIWRGRTPSFSDSVRSG